MPRPRSFRSLMFTSFWSWVGGIALVAAVVFALVWTFSARKADRLAGDGVDVTAQVIDRDITRSRSNNGGNSTHYYLTVLYESERDGRVTNRISVSHGFYNQVELGQSLPVRYWREDPSVAEVEPGAVKWAANIGLVGLLICGALALYGLGKGWRRARTYVRLRETGFRRQATVLEQVDTGVKVNNVRQYRITWRAPDGGAGQSLYLRRERLPEVGSEINIFVDPDGQVPSIWEGDVTLA